MKKSKVDAIVKKHAAEAAAQGRRAGADEERRRWERLLPVPGDREVTWLHEPPKDRMRTVMVFEPSRAAFTTGPHAHASYHHQRIDFVPVPMAIVLATGQQVRWFHWKPVGPYPITELAVLR